jgi:hypothetical protein
VRGKFTLREHLQETPEPHSRNPKISPEFIEKLRSKGNKYFSLKTMPIDFEDDPTRDNILLWAVVSIWEG